MKINILGAGIDSTSIEQVIDAIKSWIINNKYFGRYICVSNVHMIMESYDDNKFMQIINNAHLAVPDGRPLVWAQKLLGVKNSKQVRGSDLTLALCVLASNNGYGIGFYGGSERVLKHLITRLTRIFPKINISYAYSPPFRPLTPLEDRKVTEKINSSDIKILFVGIGCPKQEYWMEKHSKDLKCIMIGVGAAFDFIAGSKKDAPVWMQAMGLEWLFRFISEPKRLWKRYLKHNPKFIWYFILQLLGKKYE